MCFCADFISLSRAFYFAALDTNMNFDCVNKATKITQVANREFYDTFMQMGFVALQG